LVSEPFPEPNVLYPTNLSKFFLSLSATTLLQALERGRRDRDADELAARRSVSRRKKPNWTTLLIIDSQAVKNTCNANVNYKGFCFYKLTNVIKRHLAVDMLGFPFFTQCTRADVSDDAGLIEKLKFNIDYFQAKPISIFKITILLNHGYLH
jgi:hypothetical protein